MPHLDLSDDEAAVLAVELIQLISRAKYPFNDRVRTLGAIDPQQAEARAGSRALAAAQGLRVAVERRLPATRLGEATRIGLALHAVQSPVRWLAMLVDPIPIMQPNRAGPLLDAGRRTTRASVAALPVGLLRGQRRCVSR